MKLVQEAPLVQKKKKDTKRTQIFCFSIPFHTKKVGSRKMEGCFNYL